MRKAAAVLMILLLVSAAACASAVELETGGIRAFDRNILKVTSEEGGRLTIEAWNGTLPIQNPVSGLEIEAGTVEIPWDGLGGGGEPVPAGQIRLRATLACRDRTTELAEITVIADTPKTAAVCCLTNAQRFYPDKKNPLMIEIALSGAGAWEVSAAPLSRPEETVWRDQGRSDGKSPVVTRWSGMDRTGKPCESGEYVISARTKACPEQIQAATVTIQAEPLPEPELTMTGSLIPEDLSDDQAVWDALTAPVAVGAGTEAGGLLIMPEKGARSGSIGTVTTRTVGVSVLEITDDGWVRVGAWLQPDGRYAEGWVKAERLRMIWPNDRYGAGIDKKAQTMTVYEAGKKIGTVLISTGYEDAENGKAYTRSGVYLMGTRMEAFSQSGHFYNYPVKIDGGHLIHSSGFTLTYRFRDYDEELASLGTKASHGCIRIDPRSTEGEGGINAWWVWTHMGHDAKIIVIPEK